LFVEKMATPISTANFPLLCSNCHERTIGTHICGSCGKLRQLPEGTDFFTIFELPRKLWIEMDGLEQKFLQLSWKLHPDNFVNASEEEREVSLKRSSELNDAYRTLRDPVARVEYLLAIEGERQEGEKRQQAPPELLEEVFELNESLDELREAKALGGELSALKARLQTAEKAFGEKLSEVDSQLQGIAREWDAAVDASAEAADRKALMSRMNESLNRRSYIRNLVTNVAKELGEI
jgi:molecular chaperone HscB